MQTNNKIPCTTTMTKEEYEDMIPILRQGLKPLPEGRLVQYAYHYTGKRSLWNGFVW